jgi:hypothetical protein
VEVIRAADPTAEVNRRYRLRGWTDGLPIVPPTIGRVDEIDAGALDRHAVLGEMEPPAAWPASRRSRPTR